MKEKKHNKAHRSYALIRNMGVVVLAFFMLASIAGAASFAYVTNYGEGTVSVIDTAKNTVTATVPVGNSPEGVTVSPDGTKVYVTGRLLLDETDSWEDDIVEIGTVSVIDTATNNVTASVNVGVGPQGVAVSPDGTKAYVTNEGRDTGAISTVSVIDTATNTVTATVNVGIRPRGIAVTPDGTKVYVMNYGSNEISIIDTANDTVTATVNAENPWGIAISPDGTKAYVTNNDENISVIDTATNTVTDTVHVGGLPKGVAVSPDGTKVYVTNGWYKGDDGPYYALEIGTVSVIDTATNAIIATVDVGHLPEGVAGSPDGTKIYVTNFGSDSISIIDTATNTVTASVNVGSMPGGVAVTPSTIVPSEIQITKITNSKSASDPHIYGDRIVYADSRNEKTDIYLYDLTTKQETQISTSGTANYPAIYGDRIVWKDDRDGKSDIYMYDISTSHETQISTNGTAYSSSTLSGPDIYNEKIVWQELSDSIDSTNLIMYDLSAKQETQITTSGSGGVSVTGFYGFAIHGDKIVMCNPIGDDASNIDLYDLSTQETIWIGGEKPLSPDIYGDKIVWTNVLWENDFYDDPAYYYYNIHIYDLTTQQEIQVSTSGTAYRPAIYSDRIVWEDGRNGQNNIYMYDLSIQKETQISTSGKAHNPAIYENKIVWVEGNDIYMGTVPEGETKLIVSEIEVSDNRLREGSPSTVLQTSSFIDLGSINGIGRYRDIIQFDLGEYTKKSQIDNAVLSLYWYYPAEKSRPEDTVIEIYRPASAWNSDYVSWNKKDNGVSWTNPGGDWYDKNGVLQGSTPYATITIKGSDLPDNRYYELDVTELVKEYVSGKYENTGLLIKARSESNNYIAFYSSDWENEDQGPKLKVTKIVPAETVNATITGATDNRLREGSPSTVLQTSSFIDIGAISGVGRYRDVMLFDLDKYADADVSNAALSLYWYYPSASTRPEDTVIEVYRPASSWNPSYVSWTKRDSGISWKNAGGDWYDKKGVLQGSTPYATITIKGNSLPDNRYYELDVTNLVKEYTSGKHENTGFLIKARSESNNYIAFYSSDCGNENQIPKLQLEYS